MDRKEAYEIVFKDLMEIGMFKGIYDATEESSYHFMYGIQTVMEHIAYNVSEECYNEFVNEFLNNMADSKEGSHDW